MLLQKIYESEQKQTLPIFKMIEPSFDVFVD